MKKLSFNQMEAINGGGEGRRCMILGGLTLGSIIGGFIAPPFWGAAVAMAGLATVNGCFD